MERKVTLDEVGLMTMEVADPCARCQKPTNRFSLFFEAPLHPDCEVIWVHEHDKDVADQEGDMECLMKNTMAYQFAVLAFAWSNLWQALTAPIRRLLE